MSEFMSVINFIMPLIKFLELVAAILIAGGVTWKFFGPKIKNWVKEVAEEQDKKRVKEIMAEIDKLIEQQKEIVKRLDKQEEADLLMEGYSILRACKEALQKGEVGELEYKQLCDMYKMYSDNDGNGYVEKIWNNFIREVKIKQKGGILNGVILD